jgi:hypothetical protein
MIATSKFILRRPIATACIPRTSPPYHNTLIAVCKQGRSSTCRKCGGGWREPGQGGRSLAVLTFECSDTCIMAMHVVSQDDLISIAQFHLDQHHTISSPQTESNFLPSLCPYSPYSFNRSSRLTGRKWRGQIKQLASAKGRSQSILLIPGPD